MSTQLKRSYYLLLLPAVVFIAIGPAARVQNWIAPGPWIGIQSYAPWLFVLAVGFAAAAPVLWRGVFAHRMRRRKTVPHAVFMRFQQGLIRLQLMTLYIALIACMSGLPRFHQAGIILAALYAVYYAYPSARRIDLDRRIFRVK